MQKMWAGRTDGITNAAADDFNSSIAFDSRMYSQDIKGSIAHAKMLAKQNIISSDDAKAIIDGLTGILGDLETGELTFDPSAEDIHMFVEQVLTERIGDAGKKLHTARSRNDQVALDLHLYLRDEAESVLSKVRTLISALTDKAEEYKSAIMPGYTHLQRAQPVTFGHYLSAYSMMLLRDAERLEDCRKRIDISPIGCCALAGTTYDTDRYYEAELLGFENIYLNSLDGVSDRDFAVELAFDIAMISMHLSRLSEELILWSSWEFRFITLSDNFTTGSSIMPQKKNPDMAELCRGKTGRVYGDLMQLLTVMKGLPLAYNKDMQEDKESIFDSCDTIKKCLDVFAPMISEMKANTAVMRKAAENGFINATDLADWLVGKGLPFRSAYKISGQIVSFCIENGCSLENLPLEKYRQFSDLLDESVFDAINLENCVSRRLSVGSTSVRSVEEQISYVRSKL